MIIINTYCTLFPDGFFYQVFSYTDFNEAICITSIYICHIIFSLFYPQGFEGVLHDIFITDFLPIFPKGFGGVLYENFSLFFPKGLGEFYIRVSPYFSQQGLEEFLPKVFPHIFPQGFWRKYQYMIHETKNTRIKLIKGECCGTC